MTQRDNGDTRTRILDVAERLFSERGLDGTSLREINQEAGSRNVSAIQYHFGSREGLLGAILERRMASINRRRVELLERLSFEGRDTLHDMLGAFVYPLAEEIEASEGGRHFVRVVNGILADSRLSLEALARGKRDEGLRQVNERISAALTNVPPNLRRERMSFVGSMIYAALAERARHEGLEAGRGQPPWPAFLANLIDVTAAAVNAPVSERTLAEMRRGRSPKSRRAS